MKSIIQTDRVRCYLCGRYAEPNDPLDEHHVFPGANRGFSEKYGLKVYLHHFKCHIFGKKSVHANPSICRSLQDEVQRIAMRHYGWTIEDFIRLAGKNYIEDVEICTVCGTKVPKGETTCIHCRKGGSE